MRVPVIAAIGAAWWLGSCTPVDDGGAAAELLRAAEAGEVATLQAILEQDGPADVVNACRWTPLMKGALNGHRAVVERLLAYGAAIDAADKGGYTALMLAASNNHAGIVELLLQQGAAVDHVEATNGWTALIWAAKQGHVATVDVLVAYGADVRIRDHSGRDAREWAAEAGHQEVLARLAH